MLLTARQAGAALAQLVLDLRPQRGLAQRPLHALFHVALAQVLEELHPEGDVVIDRHRKWRGLLEHHADLGADQGHILLAGEQVLAVQHDLAFRTLLWIEFIHAVEGTQQG
ncbi:hypothetical protein D3C72_2061740 [compost metagenome]